MDTNEKARGAVGSRCVHSQAKTPARRSAAVSTKSAGALYRSSHRHLQRISGMLGGLAVAVLLLKAGALFAVDTNLISSGSGHSGSSDETPNLRPPLPEIGPTFWEQHRLVIGASATVVVMLGALSVWYLVRPKPPALVPPVAQARVALDNLIGQPENGAVLSRVSYVVRHYFTAAFNLPPVELTTTEFCQTISQAGPIGPERATAVGDFLRQCDQRKFAPLPVQPPLGAVCQAANFIDQAESRREALARAEKSNSSAKPSASQ